MLLALGLLGGGGFFAYKKNFLPAKIKLQRPPKKRGQKKNKRGKIQKKEGGGSEEQPPQMKSSLIQLPTIIVNLADPLGKRYLKVTIEIEVKGKDPGKLVEEKNANDKRHTDYAPFFQDL